MQRAISLVIVNVVLGLLALLAVTGARAMTDARHSASSPADSAADSPAQCPAPRPVTPIGTGFFTDISEASGIRDQNFDPNPPATMKINDHSRLAFADINGDGWDDMVMHNLFPNPRDGGIPFEHLVFLNTGDGTFTNFSDESGLRKVQAGFFLFGDIDNDGDQDVFAGLDVPLPRPDNAHRILLNDGAGHFTEKRNSGVNVPFQDQNGNYVHYAGNAVFADFDGDADLDLYVGNGQSSAALPDQVFIGNGDGTFTYDASRLKGPAIARASNGTVTCDYDNDGDQDIFVSVYGISVQLGHNLLWQNDGKGSFTNVARERGFEALATGNYYLAETGHGRNPEPGKTPDQYVGGNGFGLQCEDVTNDGLMDVFLTNISHPNAPDYNRTWSDPSQLLINQGPDKGYTFVNEWLDRGLPFNEGDVDGGMADFDNDGLLDLSISRDRKYEPSYTTVEQLAWFGLMHQRPDGQFESVGLASGINDTVNTPPDLLRMKAAQNHAWSDIDHDGDLDLLVGGRSGGVAGRPNFLFRNEIGSQNDWLAVRLVGDGELVNRDAVGARVALAFPDEVLMREVKTSRGMYNSIDTRVLHFGLGGRSCDYTLKVTWPDGTVQTLIGLGRNRWLTLRYGEIELTATPEPDGDMMVTGRITDAMTYSPIAGATVGIGGCGLPQPFQGTSGADGAYTVRLPAPYPHICDTVTFEVSAAGYTTVQQTVTVAALHANARRNFALEASGTPSATPPAATPTIAMPSSTATPGPGDDVGLVGRITDAKSNAPIAGATVAIGVCVPHQPFQTSSSIGGDYSVLLPAQYANLCDTVTIEVRAAGYMTIRQTVPVAALRANPTRDFALVRTSLFLPLLRRGE